MNPRSSFLQTLADISLAPGVVANSVIAVKSELVIRSGHTLQDQPETVEEVRRILLLHARDE